MRRSAEKICWEDLLRRSAEKICWENLLRRSAEKICWENLLKKICWEDLLRRSAEKICWEDLLRMVVDQDFFKISFFFYAGWVWSIKTGDHPLVTSCSSDVQKLWWNANFVRRRATLSSLRAHRTSKTVVKCEFCTSSRNPLIVSRSSDVQNWGEMRILYVVVATLSSFRAHRTSKTEVKCEFCTSSLQPSRRFVLIGRPKLRWNANWLGSSGNHLVVSCSSDVQNWGEMRILNFVLATLSSLRAGRVVKWWFLYAACCPGLPALDSYIFAYAAVVKRGFWNVEWHAVVARRTFCFCWMNPLVGFGGSMARNCGETQIFYGNCRKHRAKRSFWKLCFREFEGSLARNVRFGSLFCEISRKPRAERSFWKLVLWNFEEASHKTFVLEACSVKFWRKPRTKRSFWKLVLWKHRAKRSFCELVLWNFEEASHETIVLGAFSVKIVGSIARNARFESLFCEIWRKPCTKRSLRTVKFGFGGCFFLLRF